MHDLNELWIYIKRAVKKLKEIYQVKEREKNHAPSEFKNHNMHDSFKWVGLFL